jgi:protein-disulfide isomerase
MTRTLFHDQRNWFEKVQAADPATLEALQNMSPAQRFSTFADIAGLKTFAAQRGVPRAKADQCLANEADANQLVQMNTDAISNYSIPGTPAFLINGSLADQTATWETLEPKIKEALAS